MGKNTMWSRRFFFGTFLILVSLMLSACASSTPQAALTPTLETTRTNTPPTQTATPRPTETETPDPYAIDMEKFTNFPQSYDYLLNHLADFVQSPDPVNNRAEFDKWFQEQLIPALGPVEEREVNLDANALNARYSLTFTNDNDGSRITNHLHSFYFVHNDVVYFTPCFHTVSSLTKPGRGINTVCIAMFDNPQLAVSNFGNNGIEALYQGHIYRGYVLFNPKLDRPDLDYGEMQPIIESVGEYFSPENYLWFGFGFIVP